MQIIAINLQAAWRNWCAERDWDGDLFHLRAFDRPASNQKSQKV
jgi:hypothetical protein